VEDPGYAARVSATVPAGTIDWRGFLSTPEFQAELGHCRVLLNTPKWNEAFCNVVVEAMACGVPVVAYRRGGPGELVHDGVNGLSVDPDDVAGLVQAVGRIDTIGRAACRRWAQENASREAVAERIENWVLSGLKPRAAGYDS